MHEKEAQLTVKPWERPQKCRGTSRGLQTHSARSVQQFRGRPLRAPPGTTVRDLPLLQAHFPICRLPSPLFVSFENVLFTKKMKQNELLERLSLWTPAEGLKTAVRAEDGEGHEGGKSRHVSLCCPSTREGVAAPRPPRVWCPRGGGRWGGARGPCSWFRLCLDLTASLRTSPRSQFPVLFCKVGSVRPGGRQSSCSPGGLGFCDVMPLTVVVVRLMTVVTVTVTMVVIVVMTRTVVIMTTVTMVMVTVLAVRMVAVEAVVRVVMRAKTTTTAVLSCWIQHFQSRFQSIP